MATIQELQQRMDAMETQRQQELVQHQHEIAQRDAQLAQMHQELARQSAAAQQLAQRVQTAEETQAARTALPDDPRRPVYVRDLQLPKLGTPTGSGMIPEIQVSVWNSWLSQAIPLSRGLPLEDAWSKWVAAMDGNYQLRLRRVRARFAHGLPEGLHTLTAMADFFTDLFTPPETEEDRDCRFRERVKYKRGMTASAYIALFERELAATPQYHTRPFPDETQRRLFLEGLRGTQETENMLLVAAHDPDLRPDAGLDGLYRIMHRYQKMYCPTASTATHRGIATSAATPHTIGTATPMEVNQATAARGPRQDKRTMECDYCHKLGHFKRECRKKKRDEMRQRDGGRRNEQERGERRGRSDRERDGHRRHEHARNTTAVDSGSSDESASSDEHHTHHSFSRHTHPVNEPRFYSESQGSKHTHRALTHHARKEEHKDNVVDADVVVLDPLPGDEYKRQMMWEGSVVTSRGEEKGVRVLIDSGATRNMISERTARALLRVSTGRAKTTFRFADGGLFTSDKYCPKVQLRIKGYTTTLDLLVCRLHSSDVILGMEWLHKENPAIDWTKGTITLQTTESGVMTSDATTTSTTQPRGKNDNESDDDGPVQVEYVTASAMRRTLKKPGSVDKAAVIFVNTVEEGVNEVGTLSNAQDKKGGLPGVNDETPHEVKNVINEYYDLFAPPTGLPPSRPGHDHKITLTTDARPPYRYPFRLSPKETEELEKQLKEMLAKGHIQPSNSPFGAPVLFAKKKDGTLRLCIDYRALNKSTVRDRYPLPHIGNLLDKLSGAKIFSTMDCKSGFHQNRMDEKDMHKTAFVTHQGSFEWRVLPMGLTNAPATFQRLMNSILGPFARFCAVYLDDIIIFSKTEEEHAAHVRKVFQALRKNAIHLHPTKCHFGRREINFLGYVVAPGQIKMQPDKVKAVRDWVLPTNKKQLQSFLGFTNFYRDHIKHYAHITAPLTDLLADTTPHTTLPKPLPADAVRAFSDIKEAMCKAPVLRMVDPTRPFIVYTDASDVAVGAVLHQVFDDGEFPVAFKSRKLTATQQRYHARDRELLAVRFALEQWRHYLLGERFTLYTDHQSLQHLDTMDVTGGGREKRLLRWTEYMSDYDMEVKYIKGEQNIADGLTRNDAASDGCDEDLHDDNDDDLDGREQARETAEMMTTRPELPGTDEPTLRKDEYFGPIVKIVKDQDKHKATPAQLERAKHYRWVNNTLFKESGSETAPLRQCVAGEKHQRKLIHEYHDTPAAGHPGHERTSAQLSHDFYWPRMDKMVRETVKRCATCQRTKANTQPHAPLQPIEVPSAPGECVSVDFMELPLSTRGNDYIMVCVDKFTKMIKVAPTVKSITSAQSAELFISLILPTFARLPSTIISDRDSRFKGEAWSDTWKRFGTSLNMTTAHRPQADGQTERANRQVQEYLRCYVNANGSDWDEPATLALMEFALNSHKSSATRSSAFELHLGRRAVLPAATNTPPPRATVELEARWRAARDALHEAQEHMVDKTSSSKPPNQVEWSAGDEVLLNTRNYPQLRRNKLKDPFYGPLKIKRVLSPTTVELALPAGWEISPVINTDSLKRYHRDSSEAKPPSPIIDDEGEENFLIERVIDMRTRRGHRECLVKWLGYGPESNTWEPVANIGKKFIDEFTATLPKARPKRK